MEINKITTLVEMAAQLGVDGDLYGVRIKSMLIGPSWSKENSEQNFKNSIKFECNCCRNDFVVNVEIEKEVKPPLETYSEAIVSIVTKDENSFDPPSSTDDPEPAAADDDFSPTEEMFTQLLVKEEKPATNRLETPAKSPKRRRRTRSDRCSTDKNLKLYNCDHCLFNTNSRLWMERHVRKHAKYQEKKKRPPKKVNPEPMHLLCECHGQVFSSKQSLYYHLWSKRAHVVKHLAEKRQQRQRQEKSEGKIYFCQQCPREFPTLPALRSHIHYSHKVMVGEKRHSCPVCGERFHFKSKVQDHIDHKHMKKPWICDTCGENFSTRALLQRHDQFTHKDSQLHPCGLCDKKFKYPYLVRYHQRMHTGEKIPCPYPNCTAAYADPGTMSRHKKQHRENGDQL